MSELELVLSIVQLKKEKNAIILAHTYDRPEVQAIADIVGDSYALSKKCVNNDCDVIVFCGVYFMAESAKILSPEKKVLIPEKTAGCPMADMVTPEGILELKKKHPNAKVVTYINSSAAVKAVSDVIVTSSNALKVVKNMDAKEIIFTPDKNLGGYVASKITDKKFILWDGYCPVHNRLTVDMVNKAKALHPEAKFVVHPEAPKEVVDIADYAGSTKGIIDYINQFNEGEFIVGTEEGVRFSLQMGNKEGKKTFYMLDECLVCDNMKLTTLESVYKCLKNDTYEVNLDENIITKASKALNEMIKLAEL